MSPKKSEYTERINIFFSPSQLEKIKALAEQAGISVSAFIRMIIIKEINK